MDEQFPLAVSLLRRLGADTVEHPGGDLFAHLQRVEARLGGHGADHSLRLAGLTHAVYGTDGFDRHLLGLDERTTLTEVVGADAEELVYLYASCDRKQTWMALGDSGQVHDRWTGEVRTPDADALARFVDLTIVNELDVADHALGFKEKYSVELLEHVRSWEGLASHPVTEDAYLTLAL